MTSSSSAREPPACRPRFFPLFGAPERCWSRRPNFVGGTSALSAGSIWIPNTRHASASGRDRQGGERREISAADRRKPCRRCAARGLPEGRSRGSRGSGKSFRCKIARLCPSSRLSLGTRGRGARRACAGAIAVRRTAARRCVRAGSPAAAGVHAAWRHDGRQDRYRSSVVVDEIDQIAAAFHGARFALRARQGAPWPRHATCHGQCPGRPAAAFLDGSRRGHRDGLVAFEDRPGSRRRGVGRDAGIGGRVARDRRQRRADFGGRRFQPPRRAASRRAWN